MAGEGPLASASLSRAWSAIRSFFRWHAEQFGNRRPDKSLKCPKVVQGEIKPFTPDECGRLIKAAKEIKIEPSDGKAAYVMHFASGERNVAIIQTLLDTGIRVGEICRLTINDYNLATGEMRIRPFRSGQKTSGRYVYLGKNAKNAMWRYLTKRKDKEDLLPSDPLFSKKDGLPFDRGGMYWLVRKVGKRAGINDCHPHRFRHTAAFLYIMYGGDAFSLQKMLGHTTMDMSQKYVMMTKQDVQTQHRKSSPVDNLRGLA